MHCLACLLLPSNSLWSACQPRSMSSSKSLALPQQVHCPPSASRTAAFLHVLPRIVHSLPADAIVSQCWPTHALNSTTFTADKRGNSCLQAPLVIHAPHALPMYRDDQHKRKRKSERDRDDAAKFRKPQAGQSASQLGRGAGGNIGATGGTLLTQYVLKSQVSPCCDDGVVASVCSVAILGCMQGAACVVHSQVLSTLLAPTSLQHHSAVMCRRGCAGPACILLIQHVLNL